MNLKCKTHLLKNKHYYSHLKTFTIMKKINWLFTALAGLVLASCTGEDLSETPPVVKPPKQDVPILFSFTRGNTTRANDYFTGAEAAKLLDNKFVVTGYKGSETATPGSIVFDNYLVEYAENTANTTESNSSNWEYVGITPIKHATDNGITQQTIKYWDYSVGQYDFFAWSTGSKIAVYDATEIADGKVYVTKITPSTATGASGTAYTFSGNATDLAQCYISDLVTVNKTNSPEPGYGEVYGYDKPVTLKFRQLGTKVRIGIYETVPGYSVKDVKFYSAATSEETTDMGTDTPTLFTTSANEIFTEGTYTVYFPTVDTPADADNNQAHIKFTPIGDTQATTVDWGDLNYTIRESGEKSSDKVYIGRSSNTATFAGSADKNYYEIFLPNQSGTNLNLRVNYTLESIDGSGETINVKGATAQVPLIYTTWKPGYAYTYLFKISDKTNGYTGAYNPTKPDDITVNSDPAGLYPITFDAMVINAEEGDQTQETITTVSTPSITTYQKGSKVVDNNEYLAATGDIYVTVNDGYTGNTPDLANGHLVTMKSSGNDMVVLYRVADGTTEAFVNDALQIRNDDPSSSGNLVGRNGLELVKTDGQSDKLTLTDIVEYGVDGNVISVTLGQAAKFTPQAGTTYAFVYFKTIKTTDEDIYQPTAFSEISGTKYRYAYIPAEGAYCKSGVIYFKKSSSDVYTKHTPFIGQDVSNLYVKDGDNYIIASGLAIPGTQYYYTTDNGISYKEAKNVSYSFARSTSLYTFDGTTYSNKAAGAPANSTAYYYKEGTDYIYAVIMPEKTDDLYELDTTSYVVATEDAAVDGMTYFDKYTKNNGVYYSKVIKVQ